MSNSVCGRTPVDCLTLSVPAEVANRVVFPRADTHHRCLEQQQVFRILSIRKREVSLTSQGAPMNFRGAREVLGSAAPMIHTSSPVQNMGHLFHGVSLASPSHVLRYGFLTVKGSTGGVSLEAPTGRLSRAELAATTLKNQCIMILYKK